jgi:hypothetical protein
VPEENGQPNSFPADDTTAQSAPLYEAASSQTAARGADETADSPSALSQPDGQRGSQNVEVQSGVINADRVLTANIINEHYHALIESGEELSMRAFSIDHCHPVSAQREQEYNEIFVAEEQITTTLLSSLLMKRFLIITGEPEIGKQMLALHLSYQARRCQSQPCRETLLVRPLQRKVKLELRKVAEGGNDFAQRVIIFPQIGESENQDLLDLFSELDEVGLDGITHALKKSDSFFLFTVDQSHIKSAKESLESLGVLHEVPPLPRKSLELGLEKKVARLLAARNVSTEQAEAVRTCISKNKELLLERLPRMVHLSLFIERYSLRLIEENQELDIQAAIDLVTSPEKWFLQDLSKDFEAWCFVLTLGLCLCGAETEGVPWMEFDTIRGEIAKCLSRELQMWRRPPEAPFSNLLAEPKLLEKCRVQILHEAGVGDLVRFTESGYPGELLRVLICSNRRVLTLILPVLRRLAESGDTQIRARAARMLGRLGEINPTLITLPLIRKWVAARPLWQKAAVGYLYEGISASPSKSYRQLCELKLEQLSHGDEDQLWTAISVYKQLGHGSRERLAWAIAKLGELTEGNFTEWLEWTTKIEQLLDTYERKKKKNMQELFVAAVMEQTLKELRRDLNKVYDEDGQIMLAICYSLVALSLQAGTFAVMLELSKWFHQGRKALGALTSWIFWMEEGIADRLARYRLPAPNVTAVNGSTFGAHPVVVALGIAAHDDPQAVSQAARFLVATYHQFQESFPTRMRQYLRRKFLLHLKSWADNAWLVPEYREAMKELYVNLLRSAEAGIVKDITAQLKSDADFTGKAHLRRFADMVMQSHNRQ